MHHPRRGFVYRILVAALALVGATGCSVGPESADVDARWYEYSSNDDHRGTFDVNARTVASSLSIIRGELPGSSTPLQAAVNCSVAIRSTLINLERGQNNLPAAQTDALRQAQNAYTERAVALAARAGQDRVSVIASIEQRFEAVRDQVGSQAQAALACVGTLARS